MNFLNRPFIALEKLFDKSETAFESLTDEERIILHQDYETVRFIRNVIGYGTMLIVAIQSFKK